MSRWMILGVLATVLILGKLSNRTASLISSMDEQQQHPLVLPSYDSTTYHSSLSRKPIRHVRRNKQNPLEIVEERLVQQETPNIAKHDSEQQDAEKLQDSSTNDKNASPQQDSSINLWMNHSNVPAAWPMPHLTSESMVILILSARSHFELRQVIRETWGNGHDNVYFVIGQYCPINTSGRKNELSCEEYKVSQKVTTTHHDSWYQKRMNMETTVLMEEQEHYRDMLWTPSPESYRGLPHKLKEGYAWVVSNLPNVHWIVKADDDTVVRVGALGTYLQQISTDNKSCDYRKPIILGKIEYEGIVHKEGKWKEELYPHAIYPPFPLGSCGHVVSRPIAEYIASHKHTLREYQGEDTSLAIWIAESPLAHDLQVWHSDVFENNGRCENPNLLIIGHDLSIDKIRSCYKFGDEVQPIRSARWT